MQVQECLHKIALEVSAIQALQQDPLTQWWEILGIHLVWVDICGAVVAKGLVVLCCSFYCCGLCAQWATIRVVHRKCHSLSL